nr:NAD(P)/FAD-dependent oxidoreductase [Rhodopseudomonas rhenobacensis]
MSKRVAEIGGGGIAGLSLALMLARTGWSVRVNERTPAIREVGAGIFLRNNSIEVLEEFGVLDSLRARGTELSHQITVDGAGSVMEERSLSGMSRVTVLPRQALVEELLAAAVNAGVEVVTGAEAVGISPDGSLTLRDGSQRKADLVVAADGVHSRLRSSFGELAKPRLLPTTINRYLLPHRKFAVEPFHREFWGPNRRIGIAPAGPDATYVYQVCKASDHAAGKLPSDAELWTRSIPVLADFFQEIARAPSIPHQYVTVKCSKWSVGRAAIIGDAAHGMPPTLGQGAGVSIMNARGLAAALTQHQDVATALRDWETTVRYITDRTQAWAIRFDVFANRFPDNLAFMRWPVAWCFKNFPILNARMRIAERGLVDTHLGQKLESSALFS